MAPDLTTDVLVIGAGPAGSMTAKWAAKAGARVLMIEKRQEIGSPVRCGEGMSKDWLPEVGIKPGRWVNLEVEGARIYSPSEKVFEINEKHAGNEVGYVVERDEFDKQLAIDAANEGVEVRLKTAATAILKENGQVVGAKVKQFGTTFDVPGESDDRRRRVREPGWPLGGHLHQPRAPRHGYLSAVPHDERRLGRPLLRLLLGQGRPRRLRVDLPQGGGSCERRDRGAGQPDQVDGRGALLPGRVDRPSPGVREGQEDRHGRWRRLDRPAAQANDPGRVHARRGRGADDRPPDRGRHRERVHRRQDLWHRRRGGGTYRDASKKVLDKYEKGWRVRLEEKLYRNWLAKEKLTTLSDETFDKIIDALIGVKLEKLNVHNILKAVHDKYPEVTKEFEAFL